MRILIAEDETSFRRLLEEQLAMWGYDVVAAEDGEAALQILKSPDPPRLAILDWMMPKLSGIEVCRNVRETVQAPYIYILLLTSQQRDEDLAAGIEVGADDYITKPFSHHELRLRLRAGKRIVELQHELTTACDPFRCSSSADPDHLQDNCRLSRRERD